MVILLSADYAITQNSTLAPPNIYSMEMDSHDISNELKKLILQDVVSLNTELGCGAYGKVFTVRVNRVGLLCAAKEIHSLLLDRVSPEEKKAIKDGFIRECYHSSLIRHSNIVQFMGVYYTEQSDLPIMVMELMDTSLTSFIEKNQLKITMETKLSILHDVSLGLSHLHGHRPGPIIHRDLSSNNILLTSNLTAKIGDLGMAKMIKADSELTKSRLTRAPGTIHFMPPEALAEDPDYSTPVDVFSFGGVALHLFSEEWPAPDVQKKLDPITNKLVALSEAQRRQRYLDIMTEKNAPLKKMVMMCLDDNPVQRPSIQEMSAQLIKSFKVAS